jgi:hypothetical protein
MELVGKRSLWAKIVKVNEKVINELWFLWIQHIFFYWMFLLRSLSANSYYYYLNFIFEKTLQYIYIFNFRIKFALWSWWMKVKRILEARWW